jgi:WD40 repeat protein
MFSLAAGGSMSDRDASRDERLALVLEQAQAEFQAVGQVDLSAWQSRYPDLADELPALIETVRALDTAATDLRGTADTPNPTAHDTGVWEQPSVPAMPARVGRYEICVTLGRGGMGTVYRAHDPQLRRDVAIKIPRFAGPPGARAAAATRFLREARAAAAIHHAHVCPIHDVGEQDGTPFVVMALVGGGSLANVGAIDPRQAAELVRQVAEGLAAVHAHGIVHRDIKPANVLLDSNRQALLTDFGLARSEGDEERLTIDGALVGTPAYMAPEQASLTAGKVGPRTDVYALGAVLYELLTGRPPFSGDPITIIYRVAQEGPERPSIHRQDLDAALELIVLKAMARQPDDRYPSAKAFAQALQDWLDGKVPSPRRARRRSPIVIGVAVALLLTVVAVAGVIISLKTREGTVVVNLPDADAQVFIDDKQQPDLDSQRVVRLKLKPGKHHFSARRDGKEIYGIDFDVKAGDVTEWSADYASNGKAPPAIPRSKPGGDDPLRFLDAESILSAEKFDWQPKELVAVFGTHAWRHWNRDLYSRHDVSDYLHLAFAPDGQGVIVLDRYGAGYNSFAADGDVAKAWDAATGRRLRKFLLSGAYLMTYQPERRTVGLVAGQDGDWRLRRWNIDTGEVLPDMPGDTVRPTRVCASRDGKFIATLGLTKPAPVLWDARTGKKIHEFDALPNPNGRPRLIMDPDGKWIVTVQSSAFSVDPKLLLRHYDTTTFQVFAEKELPGCEVPSLGDLSLTPDGKVFVWYYDANRKKQVTRTWDPMAKAWSGPPVDLSPNADALALSPDGKRLVSSTAIYDAATGQKLFPLKGPSNSAGITFSPDGRRVAMASTDGSIAVYEVATGNRLTPEPAPFEFLAVSRDGAMMAVRVAGDELALRLVDTVTGKDRRPPLRLPPTQQFCSAEFSPDGKRLATGISMNGSFAPSQIWDTEAGIPLTKGLPLASCFAFSADGRLLFVSASHVTQDPEVKVLDTTSWRELSPIKINPPSHELSHGALALALSGDDTLLALWGADGFTRVYETASGKQRFKVAGPLYFDALSADGSRLAVHGRIYDTVSGKELVELKAVVALLHTPVQATAYAFSQDGTSVIVADGRGALVQYSTATGNVQKEWPQFPGRIRRIVMTANGRYLFTLNQNGTVYVLRL